MTLKEHDLAVLLRDLPAHGLHAGDVGTVVSVYTGGHGYDVEFADMVGDTVAVVTIKDDGIRPLRGDERPVPRGAGKMTRPWRQPIHQAARLTDHP